MKKAIMAFAILVMASGATTTFAYEKHGKKTKKQVTVTKYTCTMHPEVVMGKPGKCPKCGMDLVAMKSKSKTKTKSK